MSEETVTITPEAGSTGESSESPSFFSEGSNTFADGWTEQLGEEYSSLSKFNGKGVEDLAKSYSELEKKIGQKVEGMTRIPGEDATEEEIQAFRQAIGVPDSTDGYEINLPEDVLEGLDFDPDTLGPIKEAAHSLGVSPTQLNGLIEAQANFEKGQLAEMQADQEAALAELRKEWGGNADRNSILAERAASAGGLDTESTLFNNPDMQRFLANIGGQISEGQVDNIQAKTTGENIQEEIRSLQSSPAYRNEVDPKTGILPSREDVAKARADVEKLYQAAIAAERN